MTGPTSSGSSHGDAHRSRNKRSRSGCLTCRARKVKCDERPNGCANCEKLHLECSGYSQSRQKSAAPGRRTYRSCNACRTARCKCSGERPTCARCRQDSLECSYRDCPGKSLAGALPASPMESSSAPESSKHAESQPHRLSETSPRFVRQTLEESPKNIPTSELLSWLVSRELPGKKHVRVLVTSYFANFHHLRCFAFIHKPSFLRKLDEKLATGLQDNALLHIMCALGAQYYALEHNDTVQSLASDFILMAGSHWAKTSERLLLRNTNEISVEGLMTAQLLYDYALRMANFTQAFMLSALMARMTQALQLNLEYSTDVLHQTSNEGLSATVRECRRRLMWSCYITDVLCGSGVDQLSLIHERDLKIQLPCNNRNFLYERPCVTKTITGTVLDFLPPPLVPADINGNMGMMAYFVQQIEIRRRVLRYIKQLDRAKLPWLPDSEFSLLDAELRHWHSSLPDNLRFTTSTIYMRQESSELAALCVFHCAYHQTMCDLYRIGTPALYKLRSAFHFPPEEAHYQKQLQWCLFREARTLAAIIAEGQHHGPGAIADSWLPTIAYDSNRIMLFYLTQLNDSPTSSKRELVLSTIPYLHHNLKALKSMMKTNAVAGGLARAAEAMLEKLGVDSNNIRSMPDVILDDPYLAQFNRNQTSLPGTPVQSAPDYVLNPLSIFRMARNDIPERHAPEQTPGSGPGTDEQASTAYTNESPSLAVPSVEQNGGPSELYSSLEGITPDLGSFFAADTSMTVNWQPAETIMGSGIEGGGLLPWIPISQLGGSAFETIP